MPNDTNGLQTKFSVPPAWTPNALRSFLSNPKIIQGEVTVATSSAGQETVRQEFSPPPLPNGISGAAFPPITMEWNKRELEESIFARGAKQKIHTGDHFALHFRSGNTTSDFIENMVNTRESEGRRSLYEFNSNIKVDGSSIIPKDPGIILSLPPNNYTTSQLDDLSHLIKNGLFVNGRASRLDQDAVRTVTQGEQGVHGHSSALSSSTVTMLNTLGISNNRTVSVINSGQQSERAALNVPLVAFKPERLMRGTNLPIGGIHLLVPESSLQSVASAEENDLPVNFCIKSKDTLREPLGDGTKRYITSHGSVSPLMVFIPGIKAEAFRSRGMIAGQSRSVAPDPSLRR
jgi:hypothetical protein